jgi:hypothetical protein
MSGIGKSGTPRSGTTPFPNHLLDEAMPRLKDTEWRILCVVVRQTLGHYDYATKCRKERDWITRSQLKIRTGRNTEALALGMDSLVSRGYITAHNAKGQSLSTPADRRKNHGRIYYGLSQEWKGKLDREPGKIEHTIIEHSPVKPAPKSSLFFGSTRKTELVSAGKPNTTKETLTKEKQTKEDQSIDSEKIQAFITLFENVATEVGKQIAIKKNTSERNPGSSQDEIGQLAMLLQKHDQKDWRPLFQRFFASDLKYIRHQDYSLTAFIHSYYLLQYSAQHKE